MKYLISLSIAVLLSSCDKTKVIEVVNPYQGMEGSVIVSVDSEELDDKKENKLPLFFISEEIVVAQLLDDNKDGVWDNALLWVNFDGKNKAEISLRWVDESEYPTFEKKTNAFLGYSENRDGKYLPVNNHLQPSDHKPQEYPLRYQSEGPIWESELVAYRSYFDARNGKDIFGKSKPALRAEKIGYKENYHKLQDWGMDILKVGNSLGAGALAMIKDDSLYRLGVTVSSTFKILENGPLVSKIKLIYTGWSVGEQSYDLEETISIFAGQKWYKSEVAVMGSNPQDTLVTGMVTLKNPTIRDYTTKDFTTVYTHGTQSENKDGLGMAVIVPNENFLTTANAPTEGRGIVFTRMVYLQPKDGLYTYYFTYDWEGQEESYQKIEAFEASIQEQVELISANTVFRFEN